MVHSSRISKKTKRRFEGKGLECIDGIIARELNMLASLRRRKSGKAVNTRISKLTKSVWQARLYRSALEVLVRKF